MKKRLGFFFLIPLALFIGLYFYIHNLVNKPFSIPGSSLVFEVKPSMTAKALVEALQQKQVISNPQVLLRYIQWKGLAPKFKRGFYDITKQDSLGTLMDKIVKGQVLTRSFTIVEGITMATLLIHLEKAPLLSEMPGNLAFLSHGDYPSTEGLVLADTYRYEANTDPKQLLLRAQANLLKVLTKAFENRSLNVPYKTPYELLIAASILEKETADPEERRLISGVIVNRLKKGMPLQMDPTVIYALGNHFQGSLTKADLQINSPFNTYKNKGLPPTPIAIVGKDSIEAAAHPASTDYLYFVAKGDGKHQFSTTYEDQRQAVEHYRTMHGRP